MAKDAYKVNPEGAPKVDKKVQKAFQLAGFHAQGKKSEMAKKMSKSDISERKRNGYEFYKKKEHGFKNYSD